MRGCVTGDHFLMSKNYATNQQCGIHRPEQGIKIKENLRWVESFRDRIFQHLPATKPMQFGQYAPYEDNIGMVNFKFKPCVVS